MRINHAAVVVAAVVYWLLGALWYGVLFGGRWVALEGLKTEQLQQQSPTVPYIIAIVANLVLAYVLAQGALPHQLRILACRVDRHGSDPGRVEEKSCRSLTRRPPRASGMVAPPGIEPGFAA